jgi:hypothetical protein
MKLQKPSLDPCQDVPAGGRSVTFNKLLTILYGISTYKQHLVTRQVTETSSSSTGTTARCGLWPVEQYPSIFPYLSPTLSIIVKSTQLFPLVDFRNNKFFIVWGF